MGKRTFLTESEEIYFRQCLGKGDADAVFEQMAIYLERNDMQISDHILRLYIEKDFFKCLSGKGAIFSQLMRD